MKPAGTLLALVATLVAACSGPPGGTPSPAPVASPPPSPAATSRPTELVVGGDRPVTVHLPPTPDPAGAPLLIVLHGYSSSPSGQEAYFGLGRVALARGIAYAYPAGTVGGDGNRFWNATDACCNFGPLHVDDAAYLAGLIDEISARVDIDPRRVYVVGHSNGGFMSHRMACSHADQIAAIVSLAGATFVDPADCTPAEPAAVLQIHGTADDTVRFEGGNLAEVGAPGDLAPYPGARATVAAWATADGCDPELVEDGTRIDVDATIDGPDGPAEAVASRSTGCDPGGFVELWTIPGGGHVPALSSAFPGAVLDFLEAHPKP